MFYCRHVSLFICLINVFYPHDRMLVKSKDQMPFVYYHLLTDELQDLASNSSHHLPRWGTSCQFMLKYDFLYRGAGYNAIREKNLSRQLFCFVVKHQLIADTVDTYSDQYYFLFRRNIAFIIFAILYLRSSICFRAS